MPEFWRRAAANAGLVGLLLWLAPVDPAWLFERPEGRWFTGFLVLWGTAEWIGLFRLARSSPAWNAPPPSARWLDRGVGVGVIAALTVSLREWDGPSIVMSPFIFWAMIGGAGLMLRGWAFVTLGTQFNQQLRPSGPWLQSGPYKWMKHPAYLGLVMVLWSLTGLLGSRSGFLIVSAGVAPLLMVRGWLERKTFRP